MPKVQYQRIARRPEENQDRQRGDGDAEPGHHERGQGIEQLAHDHEGEAPEAGHGESERDVGGRHGGLRRMRVPVATGGLGPPPQIG